MRCMFEIDYWYEKQENSFILVDKTVFSANLILSCQTPQMKKREFQHFYRAHFFTSSLSGRIG